MCSPTPPHRSLKPGAQPPQPPPPFLRMQRAGHPELQPTPRGSFKKKFSERVHQSLKTCPGEGNGGLQRAGSGRGRGEEGRASKEAETGKRPSGGLHREAGRSVAAAIAAEAGASPQWAAGIGCAFPRRPRGGGGAGRAPAEAGSGARPLLRRPPPATASALAGRSEKPEAAAVRAPFGFPVPCPLRPPPAPAKLNVTLPHSLLRLTRQQPVSSPARTRLGGARLALPLPTAGRSVPLPSPRPPHHEQPEAGRGALHGRGQRHGPQRPAGGGGGCAAPGPARVRRTRGRRRREVLRATAPGAFPPLPFAPGRSGPGPAGGGVRPELARRGRHCLPALRGSRRARVGRHPLVPLVGLRRRRGPTPAALAPQAGSGLRFAPGAPPGWPGPPPWLEGAERDYPGGHAGGLLALRSFHLDPSP